MSSGAQSPKAGSSTPKRSKEPELCFPSPDGPALFARARQSHDASESSRAAGSQLCFPSLELPPALSALELSSDLDPIPPFFVKGDDVFWGNPDSTNSKRRAKTPPPFEYRTRSMLRCRTNAAHEPDNHDGADPFADFDGEHSAANDGASSRLASVPGIGGSIDWLAEEEFVINQRDDDNTPQSCTADPAPVDDPEVEPAESSSEGDATQETPYDGLSDYQILQLRNAHLEAKVRELEAQISRQNREIRTHQAISDSSQRERQRLAIRLREEKARVSRRNSDIEMLQRSLEDHAEQIDAMNAAGMFSGAVSGTSTQHTVDTVRYKIPLSLNGVDEYLEMLSRENRRELLRRIDLGDESREQYIVARSGHTGDAQVHKPDDIEWYRQMKS